MYLRLIEKIVDAKSNLFILEKSKRCYHADHTLNSYIATLDLNMGISDFPGRQRYASIKSREMIITGRTKNLLYL